MSDSESDSGKTSLPTDAELEALLDEESDEEFGQTEPDVASEEQRAILREWTASDFAVIYTRFRPHLERHARRFLRNPSQVDEVVQDVFLYLMVTLPELDSEIGVLRFLKWKVRLLALDVIRANGKVYHADLAEHEDSLMSESPEINLELERAEDAAIVRLALSKLQPRQREVLIASIYEEKTTVEIASQVGLSENATRQLMHRARLSLRKALIGEVDTREMTLSQILSVAAKKAAHEAKNAGVQALSVVAIAVLGVAAFLNFGTPGQLDEIAAPVPSASPLISEQDSGGVLTIEPQQGGAVSQAVIPSRPNTSKPEGSNTPDANENSPEQPLSSETELESDTADIASSGSSSAEVVQFALRDPTVDNSPFKPWSIDSLLGQEVSADLVLAGSTSKDVFSKNNYAAVLETGLWADFDFEADALSPISSVQVGLVAEGKQYVALTKRVDYLVTVTSDGLDKFVYVGQIREISDLNGAVFADTRLSGTYFHLEVIVDAELGQLVGSSLWIESES